MVLVAELTWPILERIPIAGDVAVSPHGIGTAAGFLIGAVLLLRRTERRGIADVYVHDIPAAVNDLLVRALIGAVIGARAFYVLTHFDQYARDPIAILRVWEGGLTLLGGLAGAILAALPLVRRRGYRFDLLMDSAAPGLAAGIAIGRLGDLAIGDHLGDPAGGWPLAWRCTGNYWDRATNTLRALGDPVPPRAGPPYAGQTQGCFDVAVHQTALYDLVQAGLLLALLLWLERKPRWNGFFITVFVYWYAAARFVSDFLRQDRRLLGLTGSQYAALAAIGALTVFLRWRRPWQRRPWVWDPPDFPHAPPRHDDAVNDT
ncbi:MAG: prolipoprotein diacylglyceryl transferase [Actinomycetota bacterium]|nr:prolipoprotein diacylglyceryl transferase [Actinomycetota bacterium]